MGWSDSTRRRHLPAPSPSAPANPSAPASRPAASMVREAPDGTVSATVEPGEAPASSIPVIVTSASSEPGFTSRRPLTWLGLLPGLKIATS